MSIKSYIESNPELNCLNYITVYQTIISLIGDGKLGGDKDRWDYIEKYFAGMQEEFDD